MSIGLILAPTGSVLQFADGILSIPQIAGSPEIFIKKFESGITLGNTGSVIVPSGATVDILDGGVLSNSGVQKNVYTQIPTNTLTTSSLTTSREFAHTGSFLLIYGTNDHKLIVGAGSSLNNYVIRYQKRDNSSINIMVSGSAIGSATWVNGQRAISSSDAYASIELIGTSAGWRIVSMYGTWA